MFPQYMRITLDSEEFDDSGFELGFGEFHERVLIKGECQC